MIAATARASDVQLRPFTPPPPFRPNVVRPHDDGFIVPGVAIVASKPHRRAQEARRLAEGIASDPGAYLSVCVGFKLPGITDIRPTFTRRGTL